ncbi:MAG: DinB family protein, partial [Bacteroidetes bacterium]|nr:DinB family protein [Bacteroidota bacterium]
MKEILSNYTAYNFWANKKVLDFIDDLPKELLDKEVSSSFRSIQKTILHIWDAELIWVSRLKGKSMDFWPSQQLDKKTSINGLLDVSQDWVEFVQTKENNYFNQECFYKSIAGKEFSEKIHTIIMHCMNHSTFHRGQVIT